MIEMMALWPLLSAVASLIAMIAGAKWGWAGLFTWGLLGILATIGAIFMSAIFQTEGYGA